MLVLPQKNAHRVTHAVGVNHRCNDRAKRLYLAIYEERPLVHPPLRIPLLKKRNVNPRSSVARHVSLGFHLNAGFGMGDINMELFFVRSAADPEQRVLHVGRFDGKSGSEVGIGFTAA